MTATPLETEKAIKARKRRFGFVYGAVAGLAFAVALWGYDNYLLSQAHALLPWSKFTAGGLLTSLTGGLAGWLTSRYEKTLLGMAFWLVASVLFSLYTVLVPLLIAPTLTILIKPEMSSLLHYTLYDNLPLLIGVAFGWIVVTAMIVAIIQAPVVEQAAFSISGFGKAFPHLICAALMLISGGMADDLNNQQLRDPLITLDTTIQFVLDMEGQTIDPAVSRKMHLAALRDFEEFIHPSRQLIVSRYDKIMESIYVLVNFNQDQWIECSIIYGNLSICNAVSP